MEAQGLFPNVLCNPSAYPSANPGANPGPVKLLQQMPGQTVLLAGERLLLCLEAQGLLPDMLADSCSSELLQPVPGQTVLLSDQLVLLLVEEQGLLPYVLALISLVQRRSEGEVTAFIDQEAVDHMHSPQ